SPTWTRSPCDPSSSPTKALSNGVITMTAPHIVDPHGLLGEALSEASPDLMRTMLQRIINELLSADADAVAGAEYGRPSTDRVAQRNGYRHRDLDTRVGHLLPPVAARAPQTRPIGADHGRGRLLPRRRLHPPHGQARQDPGHQQSLEVPGQPHGNRPR